MRGSKVKRLKTPEHPHPGRKHGGKVGGQAYWVHALLASHDSFTRRGTGYYSTLKVGRMAKK